MHNKHEQEDSDEISWSDVSEFFYRQSKLLIGSFAVLFGLVATYVLCLPTLYQSKSAVLIGERFFFASSQNQSQMVTLLESPEQIKYRFPDVTITSIKNTRIIEISSKREQARDAEADVQQTVQAMLTAHTNVLQSKRAEFVTFLQVTKVSHKENIDLIDVAATSSASKLYAPVQTTALPFSGLLLKGLGIGLFACAFVALTLSLIADQIQRSRAPHI